MDALSDLLHACDLSGSLFSRAELCEPWAVSTRGADVALFHVVLQGRGTIDVQPRDGAAARTLSWGPGDLLLMPHGDPHVLRGHSGSPTPAPIRGLPRSEDGGLMTVRHGGDGAPTSLLCGTMRLSPDAGAHLLPHLPRALHLRADAPGVAAWMDHTLRLLDAETRGTRPGSDAMVHRVAEVLLVAALRAWIEGPDAPQAGWLAGMRDPQLSRALAALHAAPEAPWTAADLARRSGMSRSMLYTRFEAVVGEAPGDYLTRWRMVLACQRLRSGSTLVAEVGRTVGYSSEAAFSRAFKRHLGLSPRTWRTSQAAGAPGAVGG